MMMMMMVYKYLSALFALSFLAGGVVAQLSDDYTLTLTTNPPGYTANVANGVVTFTGVYTTKQLISTDAFTQAFKPMDNGLCGTTAYTSGATALPVLTATTTSSSVSVRFALTLSSLVAPVYTAPAAGGIDTTGEVELCHQIELRKGGLLVNVVETRVTATINLSASFNLADSVTTSANSLSSAADTTVDAVSAITATALPFAVKAGEPILITIASTTYNIATITAKFNDIDLFPDIGDTDKFARSNLNCVAKICTFYLNLGFDFFKTPGPYTMTGTAVLKLGTRRLQQQDDADSLPEQEAPFSLTIFAAEDGADSSAIDRPIRMITTAVAAGGFVAVMVLV
jgi:hypothetical protein